MSGVNETSPLNGKIEVKDESANSGSGSESLQRPKVNRMNSIGMEALPNLENYTIEVDKEKGNTTYN